MRKLYILSIALLTYSLSFAEGTKEVAPNGSIMVDGNPTTDIAALHLDHPSYNSFAAYNNPDTNHRLNVRIIDPAAECIYLGFSPGHLNQTSPTPQQVTFEFRIKDPAGNVVFGPMTIEPTDANIDSWSEAFMGPMEVNGPGGYSAIQVNTADLMSQGWTQGGNYSIEFREENGQPLLIDFWDVTVVDCSSTFPEEKKGRLWSYNWAFFAINDFGFPVRPFNGAFYVCAPDPDNADAAFVTRIDFNGSGFRPAAFNVAFNSFGAMNNGNVMEDRKSVENLNSTQSEYSIFLNDPIEFCATADPGSLELLGVSRCSPDDYCIKFLSTKEGQIDLLLDFDGPDSMYTPGTADLLVATMVDGDQVGVPTCIEWDGLDGLGNPLPDDGTVPIPVIISYAQGVYHFPIYDAELMTDGFRIEAIRPTGSTPLLFYDDSDISTPSGSGEPQVQLTGCVLPCHRWTTFNDPNVPGFGNLNTINSWWFAQQILTQEVFLLPGYYECGISGDTSLCPNSESTLSWAGTAVPPTDGSLELVSVDWSGPAIVGSTEGTSIVIDGAGTYSADVTWLTGLGDTCRAACDYTVTMDMNSGSSIDTTVGYGEVIVINGEEYSETGEYTQVLIGANGCDSILIIRLTVPQTVVYYDFEACESKAAEGTNMDYSEFTPMYPDPLLNCADISGGIVYRENPEVNQHSCTPGVLGSIAMCVSSLDDCGYDAGNEKSVVFALDVNPTGDQSVAINSLSFFEKGPENFDWIDGNNGTNNYPTLYGIRVLKDGAEIFRMEDVPTTTTWTEEFYDFAGLAEFQTDVPAQYTFELLGYCLIGNGAPVTAWDLDEINVHASCVASAPSQGLVSGEVLSFLGEQISGVEVQVSQDNTFVQFEGSPVDSDGSYTNPTAVIDQENYVRAYNNDDVRNGVTTLDIVLMRKHMLGLDLFDEPQQYIAADVTNDGEITTLDLVEIRKVVLGVWDEYRFNTSWRFHDASMPLTLEDPWAFSDVVTLPNFDGEEAGVDFIGVKIGDVNDTHMFGSDEQSADAMVFDVDDMFVRSGESITVELNGSTVEGMQMDLYVKGASIIDIAGMSVPLDASNYTLHNEGARVVWVGPDSKAPISIAVTLIADQDGLLSDIFGIATTELNSEVYVGHDLEVKPIEIAFKGQTTIDIDLSLTAMPNPMTDYTSMRVVAPDAGTGQMSFYNVNGQLLQSNAIALQKGVNTFEVTKEDLGIASGVVICRVESDSAVAVTRLVVQ